MWYVLALLLLLPATAFPAQVADDPLPEEKTTVLPKEDRGPGQYEVQADVAKQGVKLAGVSIDTTDWKDKSANVSVVVSASYDGGKTSVPMCGASRLGNSPVVLDPQGNPRPFFVYCGNAKFKSETSKTIVVLVEIMGGKVDAAVDVVTK